MCKRTFREQRRRLLPETIAKATLPAYTGNHHVFRVPAFGGSLHGFSEFAADIREGHLRPFQHQTNCASSIRRSRSTTSKRLG